MLNFGPQLFEFDSQELGKLTGHRANQGAIAEIDRQLHGKTVSPEDQVKAIFQMTIASADGQKLTAAELARVSRQDLQRLEGGALFDLGKVAPPRLVDRFRFLLDAG